MRANRFLYVVIGLVLLLPRVAWTQGGGIAGEVRDTTGGVLPGVTIEASSPALIEKVRVATTDGNGQYSIVDLRPGVYAVTFSLAGFNTVRREGIALSTGFTAQVNIELRVGELQETLVVTGDAPTVDVQNTRLQNVLPQETLDAIPTNKSIAGFASLTLGATGPQRDVGGNRVDISTTMGIHGSRGGDQKLMIDGMTYNASHAGGSNRYFLVNQAGVQEVVLQTGANNAQSPTGGVQVNYVSKDGGNRFSVYFNANGTNDKLQSSNLTDELTSRQLTSVPSFKKGYDVGVGVGGPIMRDKLWFYTAHRWWGAEEYAPNAYSNATPHTVFYTPDLSRPGYLDIENRDHSLRLTWQATAKQKVTFSQSLQENCLCFFQVSATRAPEATNHEAYGPVGLTSSTWTYPVTNRLLFQAGVMYGLNRKDSERVEGVTTNDIAITEASTGLAYGAKATGFSTNDYMHHIADQVNAQFSVSYVTGSHNFKAGFSIVDGKSERWYALNEPPISYTVRKPTPSAAPIPEQITLWASPNYVLTRMRTPALFAEDQWVLGNATINLGVRYDHHHAWVPAQTRPAGMFVPAQDFAQIDNAPNWRDVTPRLGLAYDVFGNGRTAIKVSLGRYVLNEATDLAEQVSHLGSVVPSATRNWTDNGDYIPQESELGPISNTAFGTAVVNTRFSPDVLEGWGTRPYNWQTSASIQHQLWARTSVMVGYFRTWYGNFRVNDNVRVTPSDYDPYCVTAPVDPRLGDASGQRLCGLYDVSFAKQGQVQTEVVPAEKFGKQTEVFNGVDVAIRTAFGQGGTISGGVAFGGTTTDNCFAIDSPQAEREGFCRTTVPNNQVKFNAVYPLPWGFQVSGVFENSSGVQILANRSYTNAEIAPSLGRNLSSCATPTGACNARVNVALIEPNTMFEDRLTQVDLRGSKSIRSGQWQIRFSFDVYNLLNANTIIARNNTYGGSWGTPNTILAGRTFRLGTQVDF